MLNDSRDFDVIDFHNHYIPARLEQAVVQAAPASQRARWEVLARRLSDEDLLLASMREGDLSARVVNIPPALIADPQGCVPHETIVALNDELAGLVARHPGRIHGLASVDAYDGERSGREAERAIRDLGLRGLHVDCARGERMLDAPEARPTLEVAAKYGVPVFMHPVAPQPLSGQMSPYGPIGALFARGTANSAALIALVEGSVFSQLPALRVVVTSMAFGGLAMAAGLSSQSRLPDGALAVMRKHVFIDTTVLHPALLRASVDLLGADNVIAGSDWPIVDAPLRGRLIAALQSARLTEAEQRGIAAGNTLRLLGVG
ncbi:MAG: amidohydrolase family protein [Burkholderiales bacterium]